ncbi:hypothetical protein [Spirosoma sordidisoli]|uniref:Uncharacterized protein n=1 Tax=Spirosoma sordidisoli TaxID=2502893 RepID=A0A4V1RWF2_9BACT|nr:hypothetical protein [Spirosoma sordidisoli]RYC70058.1 hypothetical protein EQG79_09310 [Spirosoma sordidisoli]
MYYNQPNIRNYVETSQTGRLMVCLAVVSFLSVTMSCETKKEPTPAVTPPQVVTPAVKPNFPAASAIQMRQVESGLWPDSRHNQIEPQFNAAGQLTSLTYSTYLPDNTISSTSKMTYSYNSDGYLTMRKITTDFVPATFQRVSTENFDYQNGRLSKVTMTQNYDESYKETAVYTVSKTYQYNTAGHLTDYRKVAQTGAEIERYKYGYDANDKLIVYQEYLSGSQNTDVDYTFTNGLVAKRTIRSKGVIQWISENSYNADGQPIRYKVTYPATGYSFYWTYVYDDKKAPLELTSFFLNNLYGGGRYDHLLFKGHPSYPLWSVSVSNHHNILSITDSEPLGRQHTYSYQYNSQGYPTEVTYSIYNGTQKATTNGKRTYTYFN